MRPSIQLHIIKNMLNILMLLRRKKRGLQKKKRRPKFWVHPINKLRDSIGFYSIYVPVLRTFPKKFKFVFHVPIDIFDMIVDSVSPSLYCKSPRALSPDFKCYVYFR